VILLFALNGQSSGVHRTLARTPKRFYERCLQPSNGRTREETAGHIVNVAMEGPVFRSAQPTISTPRSPATRFSPGVHCTQKEPTFNLGSDEIPTPVVGESQSGKFLVSRGEQDRDDTLTPLKV
jgi:hypothetical protein